jgi:hypothetical protein
MMNNQVETWEVSDPHVSKRYPYLHIDLLRRNSKGKVIERRDGIPLFSDIRIPEGEEWVIPARIQGSRRVIFRSLMIESTLTVEGEVEVE